MVRYLTGLPRLVLRIACYRHARGVNPALSTFASGTDDMTRFLALEAFDYY